jgi:transposase
MTAGGATRDHNNVRNVMQNTKKNTTLGHSEQKVWNADIRLIHDNVRPHAAADTRALLEHFNWVLFDQPPYSPDLAPMDYHLLLT